ncbi:SMP-30/gluconolactonase/LRE family protein [Bradyrhizobium sp. PMVTL-01]|uniref:SMP-30/gluconolactonase/LRE family protein n=1 Tax=Bradyrhizobium sp. PMVTL-01 TaxID=3434999 RepID=UPI003F71CDEB
MRLLSCRRTTSAAMAKRADGMAFGADGRLYCTVYNQKNIAVLDQRGEVVDRLILDGPQPTNCAFTGGKKLRVTESARARSSRSIRLATACPCTCRNSPEQEARVSASLLRSSSKEADR